MRAATDTSKAPYQLPELLAELDRREKVGIFPTVATAKKIVELVRHDPKGTTTYLAIWHAFKPGEPWKGHYSLGQVTNALSRVGFYCIRHGMPMLVTLVVNGGTAELEDEAKSNIYNISRERGADVGSDRDTWVEDQQTKSRAFALEAWPEDEEVAVS